MSWRQLVIRLRKKGFAGPYEGGKHPFMTRGDVVLTLPNPHRGEISADLLARLLRHSGLSREEWLSDD